jgi:DNA-binding NarL/FixJ family response regulator
MKRLRVLLADDHAIVLEGLRRVLEPDFEIVAEVADGHALVSAAAALRPDIVVTDISMPLLNGIEAARQIRKLNRKVKIVFLSMHPDVTYAAEALIAGGSAYLLKTSAGATLREAIGEALRGGIYVTPSLNKELVRGQMERGRRRDDAPADLTPRQREVLRLLAEGKGLKEVAAILKISIKTAEYHKYRIMNQLGVRTNAEMTKYAVRIGLSTL